MIFGSAMLEGLMTYGYVGIVLYMVLTGCGLPMPEEVAIIAGGVAVATGTMHPWLTYGALLIGALLGDCVMYYIGRHFGRRVLCEHPLWTGFLTPDREKQVERLIARHGVKVLFVARFMVGIRGPMYITAGILRMPFRQFILADLFCATVVVTLFFGVSYFFGERIARLIREGEAVMTIVVASAAVVALLVFLWYHFRRKRAYEQSVGQAIDDMAPSARALEAIGGKSDDQASSCEAPIGQNSAQRDERAHNDGAPSAHLDRPAHLDRR